MKTDTVGIGLPDSQSGGDLGIIRKVWVWNALAREGVTKI
jgi:hypothetical protein